MNQFFCETGRKVGDIHLGLSAKAAALAVDCTGLQTAETVHVPAEHHGGLDHHFETDGTLQSCFID
jgi:hypothetical protein